ncbi:amidohydrolase family protein [Rhodococcus hoagii]|uniref:Amidase n=1 Tax=Rhodococcus hoagii (strain 103S) TaxID=685727 RepID=A0A3S5Y518_RHOH1|nr:amidohydrolase family protein [Prescottella equi]MBM4729058.1 amidohydrolase family protein [Prescottella equi]NKR43276.1 amidohydrolase family protein [Prescottella equi]NKR85823.1 amidohydrolase family protein [Prescottella equi]NKS06032.1 amidohydrolase family protein [Prescottella equi]NKS30990.1 amidohydrolase family protein [Prescottella equi]
MTAEFVIRDAEVEGRPGVDVRLRAGRICEVGTHLWRRGVDWLDARGGAVLPGLADHHLHLHALAAARASVRCGPPDVRTPDGLRRVLGGFDSAQDWVRGVGYVETVAGDLDANALDRFHARRPVRIQHRSGAMWILNSAAIRATGLASVEHPGIERGPEGRPTGRIFRADDLLRTLLPATGPPRLHGVGADLARLGLTAVTDATPDLGADSLTALVDASRSGHIPQRLHLLGVPLGDDVSGGHGERVTVGPYKIVLADSGMPDLDGLAETIRRVRTAGRAFAAHSVSRESLALLLAVLGDVGCVPGDRIEHASIVPAEVVADLRRHGLTVVTQPGFVADRGEDYRARVDERDHPDLYRCRTLLEAGVSVALSSDAPYGPLDPWAVIRAAATRRTDSGAVFGAAERVGTAAALAAYLGPAEQPGGPPRRVRPGAVADLVVLDVPLRTMLDTPDSGAVGTVLVDGLVVHAK